MLVRLQVNTGKFAYRPRLRFRLPCHLSRRMVCRSYQTERAVEHVRSQTVLINANIFYRRLIFPRSGVVGSSALGERDILSLLHREVLPCRTLLCISRLGTSCDL